MLCKYVRHKEVSRRNDVSILICNKKKVKLLLKSSM